MNSNLVPITLIAAGTDLTLEWCDLPSACAALRFSTATGRSDCVCFRDALIRFRVNILEYKIYIRIYKYIY